MIIYKYPKKAIYRRTTNVYLSGRGWQFEEIEATIIGETIEAYIEYFKETSCGYWDELGRYTAHYCLPIGFHKSRLVRWGKEVQLSLFKLNEHG